VFFFFIDKFLLVGMWRMYRGFHYINMKNDSKTNWYNDIEH